MVVGIVVVGIVVVGIVVVGIVVVGIVVVVAVVVVVSFMWMFRPPFGQIRGRMLRLIGSNYK